MARPLFPPRRELKPVQRQSPAPAQQVQVGVRPQAGPIQQPFVPFEPALAAAPKPDRVDEFLEEQQQAAPSLAIVVLGCVAGVAGGLIGYSLSHEFAGLGLEWSIAVGVAAMCLAIALAGAALSKATGSRAAAANIGLSCVAVLLTALFLGFCSVIGALGATLMVIWGS